MSILANRRHEPRLGQVLCHAAQLCLVVFLIMIVSTLVDEVDGVLGEGPEDLKTLMNQASSPLTMMNHFTS